MKTKILVFGGPNLLKGQVTWFMTGGAGHTFANPGDRVPYEQVDNAADYIARGQASVETSAKGGDSPAGEG